MKHLNKRRLSSWIGKRGVLGVTITELMLGLFVGTVMIGYAVPNFQTFIINNRTISGTNLVVSALNFARSEAIKRGVPVSTCASLDYATCTSSVWHEGWMVFTDEPIAGIPDGSDEVLRTQQGVDLDITLVSGQSFIRFAPNGALADVGFDDEIEGLVTTPAERSSFGSFVANLLPLSSAYAGSQSCNNGVCTNEPPPKGKGKGVMYEFKVCPKKKGYTGRSIEISASGQIRTVEATCS